MRTRNSLFLVLSAALALSACHSSSSGGSSGTPPPSNPAETYSATVTGIEIVRSADSLAMPVEGLPAKGAQFTIR